MRLRIVILLHGKMRPAGVFLRSSSCRQHKSSSHNALLITLLCSFLHLSSQAQKDTLSSFQLRSSQQALLLNSISVQADSTLQVPEGNSDFLLLENHQPISPYPVKKKPGFLFISKKKWIRYNPVNLAFGGLLFVYQSVISSQIAADCPYEISCSNFSKQSILEYGLIKGLALSADRLTRCTKLAAKDLHPLRINEKGMLIDKPSFYSNKPRP